MSEDMYREYCIEMLKKISDLDALRKIYTIIHFWFVRRELPVYFK